MCTTDYSLILKRIKQLLRCESWVMAATSKLLPGDKQQNPVIIDYLKNTYQKLNELNARDRTGKGKLNMNDYLQGKHKGKQAQLNKGIGEQQKAIAALLKIE